MTSRASPAHCSGGAGNGPAYTDEVSVAGPEVNSRTATASAANRAECAADDGAGAADREGPEAAAGRR